MLAFVKVVGLGVKEEVQGEMRVVLAMKLSFHSRMAAEWAA